MVKRKVTRRSTVPRTQVIPIRITKNLVTVIKRVQRDMQLTENLRLGNKASKISFLQASQELGRRLSE